MAKDATTGTVKDRPQQRRRRVDPVGSLLAALMDPAARRRGFATAALLTEWPTIVGPRLAGRCRPVAVKRGPGGQAGATLELAAGGGAALELQHAAPQLMQRINGYFGDKAVGRIVIRQWPLPPAQPSPAALPPLSEARAANIRSAAAAVTDEELREALCRLGMLVATNDEAGR